MSYSNNADSTPWTYYELIYFNVQYVCLFQYIRGCIIIIIIIKKNSVDRGNWCYIVENVALTFLVTLFTDAF